MSAAREEIVTVWIVLVGSWLALTGTLLLLFPRRRRRLSTWLWRRTSPVMEQTMGFFEGVVVGPGHPGDVVYPAPAGASVRRALVQIARRTEDGEELQRTVSIAHGVDWSGPPKLRVGQQVAVQGFPVTLLGGEAGYRDAATQTVTNAFRVKTAASHTAPVLHAGIWGVGAAFGAVWMSFVTALIVG